MAQRDLAVRLGLDSREFTQGMNAIAKNTKNMESGIRGIGDSITNLKRLAVAGFAGWGIQRIGREFLQAGIEVDRMTRAMTAITGSAKLAQGELEFLRTESNRLGLVFKDQIQSYTLMASAMKNTTLEGKGMRDIFSNIGEAATALQLPAERVKLIFYALQQMMNKGVVTMEELKRQMGDSLPGAFRIAAETAGVTLAEFTKLVEQGKVISEDFLPKYARKIAEELGSGWKIGAASARMEMNKLANTWFDVRKRIMGGGVTDEFASSVRRINTALAGWIDANEELINSEVSKYINATKVAVENLIKMYDQLPPGGVEFGILGLVLWGKYSPLKLVAMISLINDAVSNMTLFGEKVGGGIGDLIEKYNKIYPAMLKLDQAFFDFLEGRKTFMGEWRGDEEFFPTKPAEDHYQAMLDVIRVYEEYESEMNRAVEDDIVGRAMKEATKSTEDAKAAAKAYKEELKRLSKLMKEMDEEGWYSPDPFQYEDVAEKIKKMNAATEEYIKNRANLEQQALDDKADAEQAALDAAKKAMDEQAEYWKHTIERIQDFTADTLYDLFQGEIEDWQDMVDRMKDIFLRGLAEIIAKAATQSIIVPILANVVGAFSQSAGNAILGAVGGANNGVGLVNSASNLVSSGSNLYQGYNWLTTGGPANLFNSSTPAVGAASGSVAAGDIAAGSGSLGASAMSMGPYALGAITAAFMAYELFFSGAEPENLFIGPEYAPLNEGYDVTTPYDYLTHSQFQANSNTMQWAAMPNYGLGDANWQSQMFVDKYPTGGEGGMNQGESPFWDQVTFPGIFNMGDNPDRGGAYQNIGTQMQTGVNELIGNAVDYYRSFFGSLNEEALAAFETALDDVIVSWSEFSFKFGEGVDFEATMNAFLSGKMADIQEALMPAVVSGLIGWGENIDLSMFGAGPNTVLEGYLADLAVYEGMSGAEILTHADEIAALVNNINALGEAATVATNYFNDVNRAIDDVVNPLSAMEKAARDANLQFDVWIATLTQLEFSTEALAEVEAKRPAYLDAVTESINKQNAALEKQAALSYVSGMKELTGGMGVPDSWWSAIGDAIKLGIDPLNINSDLIHQFVNAIIRGEVSFGDLKDVAELLDISLGDLLSTVNSLDKSLTEIELGSYDPRMTVGVDNFDWQKRPGVTPDQTPTANPATSLWDLLNTQNFEYQGNNADAPATGETEQLLDDLVSAFNDSMRTVIETWNDFNDAMNSSSLAPVQSMEYFQNTFDELAALAAGGDVGAFGDLTNFVTSEFAPWMQDFGGDYSKWWTGIMGEVGDVSSGLQEEIATDSGLSPGLVSAIIAAIESGGNRPIVIEIDGKEILYATMQQIEDGDPYALSVLQGVMN